ncbi:MAG TPA: zinc-binding dehydrogenase [Gemmatimonadaceae bacterium]|nr:zinc-binding dehydrogenase [Gemmatimonadaceae bacterium]
MTASTLRAPALHAPPAVATMRACIVSAPGSVRMEARELPLPAAGQVRIRLEGSGVCASNLPLWEGREWFTYPTAPGAPGHEGWGVVDALGEGVTSVAVGQRVAALSYAAYATHDVAPVEQVVPLPDALAEMPFPGEPLGCAVNILRRAEIRAGHVVAIVGVGFLGALLRRLAADAGARVIAVSRRPFSLEVAHAFGAHELVPMDDHWKVIERVKSLTDDAGCDRVIECVGLQWPLDLAGELTRERGRLVIAGFHQDGPRSVNMFLWNWRGLDVINAHERDPRVYVEGMREAAALVASGRLDPAPLFTHRYPLDALGDAFEATRTRPGGFLKALVTA